jgi:3-oxoadipate enol-lactonase / 4-carboxymuconolactone decarboxylase
LPFANVNDIRLYYRLEGTPGRPVLVLAHSIGTDHGLWQPQITDLLPHFQVLRYDSRGHGASDSPAGDYTIEMLANDVIALTDSLRIDRFAYCGLSLGGMIGQYLGAHASHRLTALVLANTSPNMSSSTDWEARRVTVLQRGMAAIAEIAIQRCFSVETLERGNPYVNAIKSVLLGTSPEGYTGCCAAIRDMNHADLLHKINLPTLIITGDRDVSTPWAGHGEVLAREIPAARVVRLPAAHLSNIERPHSFTAALLEFLLPGARDDGDKDPIEAGLAVRRSVLGDEYVDRATASASDFTRDFQQFITRYAWGTIWTRPELDHRTRRLLTIAIAATSGRWEEFTLHVRAGLAHELEPCDLKEVLLQVAVYAGVPAANTGFHIANEEIENIEQSREQ